MAPAAAIPLFVVSALLTFASAGFFADRLDHIGPRLGLPEAIVGLVTAAAADAPEISSALVALARGDKEVSLGVVLGSNVFNIAAMIGLSAVLAGAVRIPRDALLVEATVGVLATVVVTTLVVGALPAWTAVILLAVLLAPYVLIVSRRPHHPLDERPPTRHPAGESAAWKSLALIVPAVALIVVGANGMVRAALALAQHWQVRPAIVGLLVLGVLTALPNAFTAVRLGLGGRGSALVSEALGSNTINMLGGILLPALVVGLAGWSATIAFDFAWLLATMLAAVVLLLRPAGMGRSGGALLVASYAVFVFVQLAYG